MAVSIKTQDQINEDMLNNISDDYEKSTGFLTGDLIKTNSIELAKIYTVIQELFNKTDVDNLSGEELTKYVKQRKGIIRKEATYATVTLNITGTGAINIGDLFATSNNTQFISTETKIIEEAGIIQAKSVIAGAMGNVGANTIISMPITISGITSIINKEPSMGGYEEETDESLRTRYYEILQKPPTSGNIYHYLQWSKEIEGVGNALVKPLWNGANTVKVIIIDSNMQPAANELVQEVQEYIDPKGEDNISWGTGKGKAPIGAYCTVESAEGLSITVKIDIVKAAGYDGNTVKSNIFNKIEEYLKSIAFDENHMFVSYAKIGALVLEADGVDDYNSLIINDTTANINISDGQVAVLDEIQFV
ncbi:baseplate J/gp47 family protein [Anaerovorax odorimutans]|uniref:baseplate J/gp47 family protein n=1 Tax=Anaerovorax odorimutans TaxID=109327 RepID=UPI00040354BB|nr:baseplate J/gp47 family protein [Anaerovorax odorimutans]